MHGKTGKPRSLDEDIEDIEEAHRALEQSQTPEEFASEFFGVADKPQEGLPTLDWIRENYKTKSAAIRYLVSLGHSVNVIAKHLGIKYQMVRNVATNPLKRGPNEDWRPKEFRSPPVPLITPKPKEPKV